jgi:hypothetical protein
MGDVINLNRFRKKKAREEKQKSAATNRQLHGRTKAERQIEAADKARLEQKLNGAFLVRDLVDLREVPGATPTDVLAQLDALASESVSLDQVKPKPAPGKQATLPQQAASRKKSADRKKVGVDGKAIVAKNAPKKRAKARAKATVGFPPSKPAERQVARSTPRPSGRQNVIVLLPGGPPQESRD